MEPVQNSPGPDAMNQNHPSPADGATILEDSQFQEEISRIQPEDSVTSTPNDADHHLLDQTRLHREIFGSAVDNFRTDQLVEAGHNPEFGDRVEPFANPHNYRGQAAQPNLSSQSFHLVRPTMSSHINQNLSFNPAVQSSHLTGHNPNRTGHTSSSILSYNPPSFQHVQTGQNLNQFGSSFQPRTPSYIDPQIIDNSRSRDLGQGQADPYHQAMDQSEHRHQDESRMIESLPVSSVSGHDLDESVSSLDQAGHGRGQSDEVPSIEVEPAADELVNPFFPNGLLPGMDPEQDPTLLAIRAVERQRLAAGRNLGRGRSLGEYGYQAPPAAGTSFQPQLQPQLWSQTEFSQPWSGYNSGSTTDWHNYQQQGFLDSHRLELNFNTGPSSYYNTSNTSEFLDRLPYFDNNNWNSSDNMAGPALRQSARIRASTSNAGSVSSAASPGSGFVGPGSHLAVPPTASARHLSIGSTHSEEPLFPAPAADTVAEKPTKRPRTALPSAPLPRPSSRRPRIVEESPSDDSQSPARRRPAKRRRLPAAEDDDEDFAPMSGDNSDPRSGSTKRAPKGKAAAAKPKSKPKARAPRPAPTPASAATPAATTTAAATTIRPVAGTKAPRFTRPPKTYGQAAGAAAPAAPASAPPPQQPARLGPRPAPAKRRRQTNEHPVPARFADRVESERWLVAQKNAGKTYKAIRKEGGFLEAESTLRGRYRNLTKTRTERRRKPQWTAKDRRLLEQAVRALAQLPPAAYPGPAPATRFGVDLSEAKIPWKRVAERMVADGASYKFGYSTVCKKWEELVEGAKRDGKDLGGPFFDPDEEEEEDEEDEEE